MCNVSVNHVRRVVQVSALVLVALVAFSPTVFGQSSTTATIRGTVQDSSGGVLPGANVTLTNAGTKAAVDTVTERVRNAAASSAIATTTRFMRISDANRRRFTD